MPLRPRLSGRKRVAYIIVTQVGHFVAGVLTALCAVSYPLLSAFMFIIFIVYEVNEDWHLSDSAYRDILVYAVGIYVAAVILLLYPNILVARS